VQPVQGQIGQKPFSIEIRHLKKSFDEHEVLKDISIEVAKGENLAVLGKSGAGKSVLIKCIVALLDPDAGTIILFGRDVSQLVTEWREFSSYRHKRMAHHKQAVVLSRADLCSF
jgi:ABC-type transporter Mla maintaining outer membrane lipid asymmetry ATPase subunit MlaF